MTSYPKRLIEVDLPIKRISAHARREKSIRHGHISTLHIWWARRPLAACRAVILASLWPDPADVLCPQRFRDEAAKAMLKWYLTRDSRKREWKDPMVIRAALLDFIAEFANWDNSTNPAFLVPSRHLVQVAHESLGGVTGTRPLVLDPFAGGGSIPLEALRVGADAFASDLNPIPVLLNKVVLEYIPKYGERLVDEVRKWGAWVKCKADKELKAFYPNDANGGTPIAFLWARTVQCEGPSCGATVPLIGRSIIATRKTGGDVAISLTGTSSSKTIRVSIAEGAAAKATKGTSRGFVVTCPRPGCGYSTPKKSVQRQLTAQHGGADTSRLLVVMTDGSGGRLYRLPNDQDDAAFKAAQETLAKKIRKEPNAPVSLIPSEPIPLKAAHRAVGSQLPLYGFKSWGDLFNARQKLALITLQRHIRAAYTEISKMGDENFARAVFLILAFALDKQADYSSSLCRWVSRGEFIAGTLAGEKKLPMMADFAESNPIGSGSGSWDNQIDWIARFIQHEAGLLLHTGSAVQISADQCALPSDAVAAMITDPPYYDSVPYSDLSDFFTFG